jgi:hypothetical protein
MPVGISVIPPVINEQEKGEEDTSEDADGIPMDIDEQEEEKEVASKDAGGWEEAHQAEHQAAANFVEKVQQRLTNA